MESKRECRHPRRTDRRMRALRLAENRAGLWSRVVAGYLPDDLPRDAAEMIDSSLPSGGILVIAQRKREIALEEVENLRRKLQMHVSF